MSGPKPLTTGQIAVRLSLPIHRVEYIIVSRKIEPAARFANLRVFDEAAVKLIEKAAAKIAADAARASRAREA